MATGTRQQYAEGDVTSRSVSIVPVEFWTDHVPVEGSDELKAVDWARWSRIGTNGSTTEERVDRLKKHNQIVWGALKPAYEAWKSGQDAPVDGTSVEAWPGVTRGQVAHLKLLNIRTVEALALADDATMDRIGLGSRALVSKARSFVEARDSGVSKLAAEKAALEGQLAALVERVAELEERAAKRKEKAGDG